MISELFQAATQRDVNIDLVTGQLHPEVYAPIETDIRRFLTPRRDGSQRQIRVLVDGAANALLGNPIFNRLYERPEAATVRALDPAHQPLPHFMLVGDVAFRVELNHRDYRAVGCFDDEHKVLTPLLAARFNRAWEKARDLNITDS